MVAKMNSCVFCKILCGEIPAQKVYEDMHTLVIPKGHYELISTMPEKEFISYMEGIQKMVRAFMKYTDGVNVLQNNGKDAGQLVPHVHFHIIPRRPGDGLKIGEWHAHHDPDLDK